MSKKSYDWGIQSVDNSRSGFTFLCLGQILGSVIRLSVQFKFVEKFHYSSFWRRSLGSLSLSLKEPRRSLKYFVLLWLRLTWVTRPGSMRCPRSPGSVDTQSPVVRPGPPGHSSAVSRGCPCPLYVHAPQPPRARVSASWGRSRWRRSRGGRDWARWARGPPPGRSLQWVDNFDSITIPSLTVLYWYMCY